MSDFFEMMRKHGEAQAVRLGLPVDRKYTDDELVESIQALAEAEHDLELEMYGSDPRMESGCALSPPELKLLREMDRRLIPFIVTVETAEKAETINILAPDSITANIRVVEMLFDFDAEKPQAFKISVAPKLSA